MNASSGSGECPIVSTECEVAIRAHGGETRGASQLRTGGQLRKRRIIRVGLAVWNAVAVRVIIRAPPDTRGAAPGRVTAGFGSGRQAVLAHLLGRDEQGLKVDHVVTLRLVVHIDLLVPLPL